MWNSSVTREHLLQKISLLAILASVRDHPKQHVLISPPGGRSSLTIEQEREIVSNLAFLSSRSKNSKRVVAIGIEEDHDGQGMVIRMAVNGGDKDVLSDNQVTVACATLGKLCQISLLPLRTEQHNTSSQINTINLLNFILMSPKTHVQYATVMSPAAF
jgi:hypothetical protein